MLIIKIKKDTKRIYKNYNLLKVLILEKLSQSIEEEQVIYLQFRKRKELKVLITDDQSKNIKFNKKLELIVNMILRGLKHIDKIMTIKTKQRQGQFKQLIILQLTGKVKFKQHKMHLLSLLINKVKYNNKEKK